MTSQNLSDLLPEPEVRTERAHCDEHGPFEARVRTFFVDKERAIRSGCPKCSEIANAKREARERQQADAERMFLTAGLVRSCGIPARFADRTLDSYVADSKGQRFALNVCRRFHEDFIEQEKMGRSLVMTGEPGTGKTHLACAVARAVIETYGVSAKFSTVSDLLRRIKETYRRDSEISERSVIDEFVRCGLLVVDELGVQIGSEHEKLLLFEVLNGRYQELRPTILISNLSADDLEEFLGHRVMDRYRECGVVLAFDWESYRGRRAA